jgi:protein FAM32A
MQKKTNFIGGALKLKNLKPDKTLKKMKKIITSDIKSLKKEKQKNGEDKVDPEKLYKIEFRGNIDYDSRTEAEKRYDDVKLKRLPQKIHKNISTTFQEKFDSYSKNLSKLPEHFDIPKVGPG